MIECAFEAPQLESAGASTSPCKGRPVVSRPSEPWLGDTKDAEPRSGGTLERGVWSRTDPSEGPPPEGTRSPLAPAAVAPPKERLECELRLRPRPSGGQAGADSEEPAETWVAGGRGPSPKDTVGEDAVADGSEIPDDDASDDDMPNIAALPKHCLLRCRGWYALDGEGGR